MKKAFTGDGRGWCESNGISRSAEIPWLLTVIVGGISGINYTAAFIGAGAVNVTAVAASGLAGACAMAVNTFLATYFRLDAEAADVRSGANPVKEAATVAVGFSTGAAVSLIGAALVGGAPVAAVYFSTGAAVMAALALLAWAGAAVGRATVRVVICWCVSIGIQYWSKRF